ncbi:MAG: hypothetical protein CMJ46_08820 [Planctomyces sp.]|nr:hypothetical protein [Planctomyces sp.]
MRIGDRNPVKTLHTTLVLGVALLTVGCQSSPFNGFRSAKWSQKDIAEQELAQLTENAPKSKPSPGKKDPAVEHELETPSGGDIQLASAEVETPSTTDGASLRRAAASNDVEKLLRDGQKHEEQGEFALARDVYKRVLVTQPVNSRAHHRLAVLADLDENFSEAEQHYRQAMQNNPLDPELLSDLGYSYLLQNRYADSESYLQQAVQMQPSHTRAVNNLGLLYARQGRREEALAQFRKTGTEAEAQRKLASIVPNFNQGSNQFAANSTGAVNNGVTNAHYTGATPAGTNPFTPFTQQQTAPMTIAPQQTQMNAAPAQLPNQFGIPPQEMPSVAVAAPAPRPNTAPANQPGSSAPNNGYGANTGMPNNAAPLNNAPTGVMQSNYNSAAPNNTASSAPVNQSQPFTFGGPSMNNSSSTSGNSYSEAPAASNVMPNGARVPFTFGETTSTTTPSGQPAAAHSPQSQTAQSQMTAMSNNAQSNWNQGQQPATNGTSNAMPMINPYANANGQGIQQTNFDSSMQNANSAQAMNGGVVNAGGNGLPNIQPQGAMGWGNVASNGATQSGQPNWQPLAQQQQSQTDAWGNPVINNGHNPVINPQQSSVMSGQYPATGGQYYNAPNNSNGQYNQYQQQPAAAGQPVINPGANSHYQNAYGGQNDTVRF